MIFNIIDRLTSAEGRLATGVALIAAIVLGLWPHPSAVFDPAKAAAIILAAVAWLFAELANFKQVSDHDKELFANICKVLNQDAVEFLAHHDFAVTVRNEQIDSLGTIALWHGADFEFNDKILNSEWLELKSKIQSFDRYMALKLFTKNIGSGLTLYDETLPKDMQPQQVYTTIDSLNDRSTEVYELINQFKKLAMSRLKL